MRRKLLLTPCLLFVGCQAPDPIAAYRPRCCDGQAILRLCTAGECPKCNTDLVWYPIHGSDDMAMAEASCGCEGVRHVRMRLEANDDD